MRKYRTAAAAGVAALALTGGAVLAGSGSAQADGDLAAKPTPPSKTAAKVVPSFACNGGASMGVRHQSADYESVGANTTTNLGSTRWVVKGPKKGADTVLVTFSSFNYTASGDLTYLGLYKDGNIVNPGLKYYAYTGGNYDQGSTQFCTRIGPGKHVLILKATESGSGGAVLYYPTVSYERFG
jgi:hypothetical protein